MAGPSGGGLDAERIASIVAGALEPAERAGGVAYLYLTPFAAGQTLAVPRQPVMIDRDCHVVFVDAHPHANWGHDRSPAGGQVWLGRSFIVWSWWCLILRELLARPYRELPETEYYERLHKIQPELAKLAASLDDQSAVLRQETAGLVGELVAGASGSAAAAGRSGSAEAAGGTR